MVKIKKIEFKVDSSHRYRHQCRNFVSWGPGAYIHYEVLHLLLTLPQYNNL